MNILLSGIHGVGKTVLASSLPKNLGFTHTSASALIKEERQLETWGLDKKASEVDVNQLALATAVKRHNASGTRLLLDGHFVLIDKDGHFSPLNAAVFQSLNLQAVFLLEAEPEVIAARINLRDGRTMTVLEVQAFQDYERRQAQLVCDKLGLDLKFLKSPTTEEFIAIVSACTES